MDAAGVRRIESYFARIGEVLRNAKRRASFAVYPMGLLNRAAVSSVTQGPAPSEGIHIERPRLEVRCSARTKRGADRPRPQGLLSERALAGSVPSIGVRSGPVHGQGVPAGHQPGLPCR